MDDNIVYATAESKQLPVDLEAGAYHGGRPLTACSRYARWSFLVVTVKKIAKIGQQKLKTLQKIKVAQFFVTHYWRLTDRQTDRQKSHTSIFCALQH